jgi:DNA-binding transcriptional MocR family regulator
VEDYRALADAVSADIAGGRLRAGDRLPTQRRFARDRGVAVSTASRVYAELSRRGLVTGEVGRGTFVRAAPPPPAPALAEHRPGTVDLEMNFPILDGQAALLAPDAEGLQPDAVRAAGRLDAVFVQPTMHNPLGVTMPVPRRRELADVLAEHDVPAIEDRIYSFLRDDPPPLAAFAPERTIVVDSLSKRVAPGSTLGFLVPPMTHHQRVRAAIRAGGWLAQSFAVEAATRWMADGVVAEIQAAKRVDAARRQALVAQRLAGFAVRADPAAYHCWWELPPPWRAETFVAAAARRGIAVTPAASYAAGAGHAPSAVRLALATPPVDTLAAALDVLAALGRGAPGDDGTE